MKNRFAAVALAAALASTGVLAQQTGQISGTAKNEASQPYGDYTVRARDINQGQVAGTVKLNSSGEFYIPNLSSTRYVVELVNKDDKVICTEGPFDLSREVVKDKVNIDCDRIPAAWWLLGAGSVAGITAGVLGGGGPESPSR